ncbi:MAG: CAP domain-containing protein [Candidatus Levyibacteriota bacterium]
MRFWKHSLTALLTFLVFSLASTILTTKAHAQESLADSKCPMAHLLLLGKGECGKKKKSSSEFLPSTELMPEITPIEKKDAPKVDVPVKPQFYATAEIVKQETATLSADLLFSMVNDHRKEMGLTPFEHEVNVCSVADSRKQEMVQEIFVTHALHAGFYAKNLPYWATENLIWQHTEAEALNWWLHSPVHKAALEGSYKYACGVCNGEVCNMVFTNYDPKVQVQADIKIQTNATTPENNPNKG